MTRTELAKQYAEISLEKIKDPAFKEIVKDIIGLNAHDVNWLWVFRIIERHHPELIVKSDEYATAQHYYVNTLIKKI